MFSWILEFISVVKAVEKKIQDEKTKRIKRRTKDEALKDSDSIAEAHEKTKNSENVVEAEKKSKKLKGQKIFIDILKFVAELFEFSIIGTLIFIGILIFFVALVVILIMFILYGFLTNTGIIPDGSIYTPNEDCIQGTQVMQSTGYDLSQMSQLMGTLTDGQKQAAQILSMYYDIVNRDLSTVVADPSAINSIKNSIGATEVIHFLSGFGAVENSGGITDIPTNGDDLFKYPSLQSGAKYVFMGLCYDNVFDGKYGYDVGARRTQVLVDTFVDEIKQNYAYVETPKYENNFMPYGVSTQIGLVSTNSLTARYDKIDEQIEDIAKQYGITTNIEKLKAYIHLFSAAATYHSGGGKTLGSKDAREGLISLWCALWSTTSDNDADRGFHNVKVVYDSYNYTEPQMRKFIFGDRNFYVSWGTNKSGFFEINGKSVDTILWQWVWDNCSNPDYFEQTAVRWFNKYQGPNSNKTDSPVTDSSYGFAAYLIGRDIAASIGISAPIATGGNIDDCDCYEGGSGGSVGSLSDIDLSNVQVGVAQGPWNADLMAKINNRKSNEGFGYFKDHFGKTFENSSRKDKEEEWRKNSKWKVPYYNQSSSANVVFWSNNLNYHSSTGGGDLDACGTYMLAYMLSAATGRLINPVEAFAVGLELDIFAANGHMQYDNNNFAKLNEYGIYITHIEGGNNSANKAKIDECLEKGGIVGVRSTNPRNKFVNSAHFFVITEKVGDKYNVYASTGFDRDTKQSYTWDVVTLGLARFFLMDNINRASEGGSNQQVGGNTQGTVSTTTSFENFLFIGDSFTVGLSSTLNSKNKGFEVYAAGGAYPTQFTKDADGNGTYDIFEKAITIGQGNAKKQVGPLPDGSGKNGIVFLLGVNNAPTSTGEVTAGHIDAIKNFLTALRDKYGLPIYVQKVFPVGSGYIYKSQYATITADIYNKAIGKINTEIEAFCASSDGLIFIDTTSGLVENGYLKYPDDESLHIKSGITIEGVDSFEYWYSNIEKAVLSSGSNSTSTNSSSVNCISTGSNSGVSSAGAIDLDLGVDDYTEKIKAGSWGHSYTKTRTKDEIKFIVVHFWGSQSKNSGDAQGLIHGYETGGMNREDGKTYMAQYVVDKDGIYRTAPDLVNVQHSGGGLDKTKGSGYVYNNALKPLGMERCTSNNSIGIEASNSDLNNTAATDNPNANVTKGFYVYEKGTIENLISLTKALMIEYNIDVDHIYRHYDCTMKTCPAPFIDDQYLWPSSASEYDKGESQNWKAFKECLTSDTIDWSKFNDHVVDNIK